MRDILCCEVPLNAQLKTNFENKSKVAKNISDISEAFIFTAKIRTTIKETKQIGFKNKMSVGFGTDREFLRKISPFKMLLLKAEASFSIEGLLHDISVLLEDVVDLINESFEFVSENNDEGVESWETSTLLRNLMQISDPMTKMALKDDEPLERAIAAAADMKSFLALGQTKRKTKIAPKEDTIKQEVVDVNVEHEASFSYPDISQEIFDNIAEDNLNLEEMKEEEIEAAKEEEEETEQSSKTAAPRDPNVERWPNGAKFAYSKWIDLETWKKMKRRKIPIKCTKCDRLFTKPQGLTKHWRKNVCTNKGPSGHTFYVKEKNEEGKIIFKCAHKACIESSVTFGTHLGVQVHWNKVHKDSCENLLQCQTCGQVFVTESLLIKHRVSHHNSKREKATCSTCGKQVANKYVLIIHERRHRNERVAPCPYCDYVGFAKADLKAHCKYKHWEEMGFQPKPFVCHLCGKGFCTSSNLKEHMSSHSETPDPKFKCPHCSKYLKQYNSFSKHMMNVHGEGERCDVCNKLYVSAKAVVTHKRDVHGIV